LKAVQVLGAERVCFGSDTPFDLMNVEIARYKAMFENFISTSDANLIMGNNIAHLLGLDR
jgi:hypothetical protein